MSLFTFLKNAGEKLFGGQDAQVATPAPSAGTGTSAGTAPSGAQRAAEAIAGYVQTLQLPVKNLQVSYDAASATVTLRGEAADQATREKAVLACGNVAGVEKVNDELTVAQGASETPSFYTVKSGDTLSKIAKEMYGNANDYMKIFEANKPMLKDPDKIYPGQTLRVPA
jgi:nucleoid-associated protein YgaU